MGKLWVRGLRNAPGERRKAAAAGPGALAPAATSESLESRVQLSAAPVTAGPEFRVNTNTAGSQELFAEAPHAVAGDTAGDFVVAWSSAGQDGSSWGVFAQRYDADGARRGSEFQVNQTIAGSQWYPSVACAGDGSFVVAWTSALQDGGGDGVYARRYSAAGVALGGEFRVNSTTASDQRHASVAVASGGAFVVVWSGLAQAGGAGWDVYAQRYDAAGAKLGGEFRVNATTAGDQQFPAVAADDAGDFVVTWTAGGQDGSGTGVYARRYSTAGTALSGEFRVNTTTAGDQQYGRVAAAGGGDFVVAWASAAQDGSGRGVYAQRFDATGASVGGEFRVNQVTTGEQFAPSVAADDTGGFVVAWTGAQDGDLFGVFARAYDAGGAARGNDFRVNTTVAGNQVYASAASSAEGALAIVWESDGQDGSAFGVYGQRFAPPDTVAPTADVVDVSPDPRAGPVDSATIRFSERVSGFGITDLRLTRDGVPANLLTVAQTLASTDGQTYVLGNLAAVTALPGVYTLTLLAAGSGITDAVGNPLAADAADTWTVLPPPARVVARHVFYGGSAFTRSAAAAGVVSGDDAAIASDKSALLPGVKATFANYTSYPAGINGIMVDVAGLGTGLTAADFGVRVGNSDDAATWLTGARPASVTVRPGAGANGSDRVTLTWPDGAIRREWMQLTVLATAATRLAAPDVFYFGNLPGETGDDPAAAAVDAADVVGTRAAIGAGAAAVTSRYDFDRNGRVDARDMAVVRGAVGGAPLQILGSVAEPAAESAAAARRDYRPAGATSLLFDADGMGAQ